MAKQEISQREDKEVVFDNDWSDTEEDFELEDSLVQSTEDSFSKNPPSLQNKKDPFLVRQTKENSTWLQWDDAHEGMPRDEKHVIDQKNAGRQSNYDQETNQNDQFRINERHSVWPPKVYGPTCNDDDGDVERMFSSGWELLEEDLECLHMVPDSQALKEGRADITRAPRKTFKRGCLRLLSKRSGLYGSCLSAIGMIASMAKAHGVDVATLMETAEHTFGPEMNIRLPCMQCHEKQGVSGNVEKQGGSMDQTGLGALVRSQDGPESGSDCNRCSKCGWKVQTLASLGKMILQLKTVFQEKGFVPHDVYPDGNCLFAAVVDQLRICGNFTFTTYTLREAAVQFLRENPSTDDGTPLEMFLVNNETWETYLTRMSEDGEWGDHIVLRALASVTDMPIFIYGGMSCQRETVIEPILGSSGSGQTKANKKIDEHNKVIYLGHIGELHYISLRPNMWRESLDNEMKEKAHRENCFEVRCPVQWIDFLIRQAMRMGYIKSRDSKFAERFAPSEFEEDGLHSNLVGSVMCMMLPQTDNDIETDVKGFVPVLQTNNEPMLSNGTVIHILDSPLDTKIVYSFANAKTVDLVVENTKITNNQLRLIPKKPSVWSGQTVSLPGNKTYLKSINGYEESKFVRNTAFFKDGCTLMYVVLAFRCAWPREADEWPVRRRPANFPDEKTIQTVVDGGCHVVPFTTESLLDDILDQPVSYRKPPDDYTWCYTFAAAEKEISRFLSDEQRHCFLIFKIWVDRTLNDSNIPNSVLKSIFFHACENIDKQKWKSKPGECLLVLLKKLLVCLKRNFAPHYFMINMNLLNGIPEEDTVRWYEQLMVTRIQPVVTLFFVLDHLNVLSSEIGGFVEEMMEVLSKEHNGHRQSESLTSVHSTLLRSLIFQEDYQSAMLVLKDMAEEAIQGRELDDDRYFDAFKRSCWDMHIGYQWCFALFVDIRMKTHLTMKLCDASESVHITEVFGPECVEELPDTLVPECFQISSGDTAFASKVSRILSQCVSGKCQIKAFKFYLKTYHEIAGDEIVLPYEPANLVSFHEDSALYKTMFDTLPFVEHARSKHGSFQRLYNMYVHLFNACFQSHRVDEFREMMPVMTRIVDELKSPTAFVTFQTIQENVYGTARLE